MASGVMAERSKRTRRASPRKIDPVKIKELHAKGLNTVEIAKHQGVAPSTVWRFLDRTEPTRVALEKFKTGRADAFAELQAKTISAQHIIVDSIHEDASNGVLRALSSNEKARLLDALNNVQGTIYDKERLERGESTQNLSTVSLMVDSSVSSLHKRNLLIVNGSPSEPTSRS